MCGRYSNHVKAMLDWSALLGDWPSEIAQSDNISPGQPIAVFNSDGGVAMRWGLIPPWAQEVSGKYSTFNTRLESVDSKPAFKHSWANGQRCLVPALGYYEWRQEASGKQPYFIHAGGTPLFFAGIFESARSDQIPASCSILTREANTVLAPIHSRMPVLLPLALRQQWFDCNPVDAGLMANADYDLALQYHGVSKQVNNARNDNPQLVDPVMIENSSSTF